MAADNQSRMVCRNCGRSLGAPADVGWECDCGVRVCTDEDCFKEWFRRVAAGEATRCLSCSLVT